MTDQDKIKSYFDKLPDRGLISINKLNELAGLPSGTLAKFLKGYAHRTLLNEQAEKVVQILEKITF